MKLLDFVAFYGFMLAPIGAIIVFEHFYSEKFGIIKFYAEKTGLKYNPAVLISWVGSIVLFSFISIKYDIFLSFLTLPAWILCGVLFLIVSKYIQRNSI